MLFWILTAAHAATLRVPDDAATLSEAVALAESGDEIVLRVPSPGFVHVVTAPIVLDGGITIRGEATPTALGGPGPDARVVLDVAAATARPGFDGLFVVPDTGFVQITDVVFAQPEADCGNGEDDDGDGQIDAADADCAGRTGRSGVFTGSVRLLRMTEGAQVSLRRTVVTGWSWATSAQVASVSGNGLGRLSFYDSLIAHNRVRPGGTGFGAIYADNVFFQFIGCVVRDNTALRGGALYTRNAVTLLQDTALVGNTADQGGAVHASSRSRVELVRNTFAFNHALDPAEGLGGAVFSTGSAVVLENDIFAYNTAAVDGAALLVSGQYQGSVADVIHSTFVVNEVTGATRPAPASVVFENTPYRYINSVSAWEGTAISVLGFATQEPIDITYSAFEPATAGDLGGDLVGSSVDGDLNLFVDPEFTDFTPGVSLDWRTWALWPVATSPLIDAGDPAFLDIGGGLPDIGAYGGSRADQRDDDDDGAPSLYDCDDLDPARAPGLLDVGGDGVDQDCDGSDAALLLDAPLAGAAGQRRTVSVAVATPNGQVALVAGTTLGSAVAPGCGRVLGMSDPALVGLARADAMGRIRLEVSVPARLAGRTYQLQAIDLTTCATTSVAARTL